MRERDVFETLAERLRGMARNQAAAHSGSHLRFTVRKTAPLTMEHEDGGLTIDADEDDVEVHRAVTAATLAVGDVVTVRETQNGYEVTGVID